MNTFRSNASWNTAISLVLWGTAAAAAFAYLYHFLRYASLPSH